MRQAGAILASLAVTVILTTPALAHVKWFCAYDVAGQPEGLANVLCQDFFSLVALSGAFLLWGCLLERSVLGPFALAALDQGTSWLRANTELLFRGILGYFFVSVWTLGGILLTPEIKTTSPYIPWFQLLLAVFLLWRRTLPLTALGMCVLFVMAIQAYGTFHLLDYPIFVGIAAYLAMTGLGITLWGARPLDVVRWSAAITLMWASVEKWAFPQWTFPLFNANPDMAMGFDEMFFMRAAGVVEFALSFCLVWTPLVRRIAALLLCITFVSAIAGFGKIDAIGHSPIIAVMLAIFADDAKESGSWRKVKFVPPAYATAIAGLLGAYYLIHTVFFGPSVS